MRKVASALFVGAVLLWIGYDVGGGAIRGVAEVKQRRLDETPMHEIVDNVLSAHKVRLDGPWTEYASVLSVTRLSDGIVFRLMLSVETQSRVGKRMTQAKRADIRNDLRDEVCRHNDLKYLMSRGGTVKFAVINRNGTTAFDAVTSGNSC